MNKLQKICLMMTILLCINYSLYALLGFHTLFNFLHSKVWIEKLYAFVLGFCAFVDILIFQKEDK